MFRFSRCFHSPVRDIALRRMAGAVLLSMALTACMTDSDSGERPSRILSPAPGRELVVLDSVTLLLDAACARCAVQYRDLSQPMASQWVGLTSVNTGPSLRFQIPEVPFDTLSLRITDSITGNQILAAYVPRYFRLEVHPARTAYQAGETVTLLWHPAATVNTAVVRMVCANLPDALILLDEGIVYPDTILEWTVERPGEQPLKDCRFQVMDYQINEFFDDSDGDFEIH